MVIMNAENNIESELMRLKAETAYVEQLRLRVLRELEMAKQTRLEIKKYQQQLIARARSDSQMLILNTRLTLKKEMEESRCEINEQMQKLFGDIRVLRITAQEELKAQRAYTGAAKIRSLAGSFPETVEDSRKKGAAVGV